MLIITIRENETRRVATHPQGKTLTEQSHRKQTNINSIVAKYHKTGLFPQRKEVALYGDFTGTIDFHDANNRIIQANIDFMSLPAEIRSMFGNDPGALLDFIYNPENEQEAIELGLLPKPLNEPVSEPGEAVTESESPTEPESPE